MYGGAGGASQERLGFVGLFRCELFQDLPSSARATLTRLHRSGDYAGAMHEFGRWNRAGGRVLRGLTRRREAEARLDAG